MRSADAELRVLEGVLVPTAWAADGEVTEVSLMTFDERTYPIAPGVAGDHGMRALVRRHVRLAAVMRQGQVVRLSEIAVIDDPLP